MEIIGYARVADGQVVEVTARPESLQWPDESQTSLPADGELDLDQLAAAGWFPVYDEAGEPPDPNEFDVVDSYVWQEAHQTVVRRQQGTKREKPKASQEATPEQLARVHEAIEQLRDSFARDLEALTVRVVAVEAGGLADAAELIATMRSVLSERKARK